MAPEAVDRYYEPVTDAQSLERQNFECAASQNPPVSRSPLWAPYGLQMPAASSGPLDGFEMTWPYRLSLRFHGRANTVQPGPGAARERTVSTWSSPAV